MINIHDRTKITMSNDMRSLSKLRHIESYPTNRYRQIRKFNYSDFLIGSDCSLFNHTKNISNGESKN